MPPSPGITIRDPGIITDRSRGGRPTLAAATQLGDRILAEATTRFLRDGYASTSMEAVAAAATVSKRTLYKRYPDKAALFHAAIEHLIQNWLPPFQQATTAPDTMQAALEQAARTILAVALTPEALALHRLMIAEGLRFPELARIMQQAGTNLGITRIAALLQRHTSLDAPPIWAAEQFQRLVLTGPQQRALGLGDPLSPTELEKWVQLSVRLFLDGIQLRKS